MLSRFIFYASKNNIIFFFCSSTESDVTEEVNEAGHYGNYYSGQPSPTVSDIPFNLSDTEPHISEQQRIRWDLNYHEAAIYLQVLMEKQY